LTEILTKCLPVNIREFDSGTINPIDYISLILWMKTLCCITTVH